jgi:MSHA biogenesis protein MshP
MRPELPAPAHSQRGFTLVSGIFLVVILAALGAFIINVSRMASSTQSLDLQGVRGYQAARAGTEWGAYNSLRNGSCAASTSLTFTGTSMEGFTTTVTCATTVDDELGTPINIDTIVALACNQPPCPAAAPSESYIERQLTIMVNR